MREGWLQELIYIDSQLAFDYPNVYAPYHRLFIAASILFIEDYGTTDADVISHQYPYGGMIGYGDSQTLHRIFSRYKIFRIHAAVHDACGFARTVHKTGPGYCYALNSASLMNHFLLGHVSGLSYWLYVKIFKPQMFCKFLV